jgi:hypothetical protein
MKIKRAIWCAVKWFVGALFCSMIVTSVAVVGWMYQAMQRATHKRWHALAGTHFDEPWPSWLTQRDERGWRRWVGALAGHFRVGAQGIFNTWVITLPGCVLWLFAWYAGWNNSFNKGYEQAVVGPLTGVLGTALFITAMFYVPVAQARQASTGNWRSFYDFKTVRAVIRQKWMACLGLAIAFSLVSLPATVLKTAPLAIGQAEMYAHYSQEQVHSFLQSYFFWACVFMFPAIVWLRLLAGRIYAGGLLGALYAGDITRDQLAPNEAAMLDRLELSRGREQPQRHMLLRFTMDMTSRAARLTCGAVAAAVWFTFIAQIFISEFLNYHPIIGWLNQPLVQLPWFKYMP